MLQGVFNGLVDEEACGIRREGTEHLNVHASVETLQTVHLNGFLQYSVPTKAIQAGVRLHLGLDCVQREADEPGQDTSCAPTEEFPHGQVSADAVSLELTAPVILLILLFLLMEIQSPLQEFEDAEIEAEAGGVAHQETYVATREAIQPFLPIDFLDLLSVRHGFVNADLCTCLQQVKNKGNIRVAPKK